MVVALGNLVVAQRLSGSKSGVAQKGGEKGVTDSLALLCRLLRVTVGPQVDNVFKALIHPIHPFRRPRVLSIL